KMDRRKGESVHDIGIVGAGIRGQLFASALQQLPDCRVVAIADPSATARAALADRVGAAAYADHRELLDRHKLTGLVVATPDFAHRDAVIDAAGAGVHLLVEKPLATNLTDAREINAAVDRAGVRAMVAFENRWNP